MSVIKIDRAKLVAALEEEKKTLLAEHKEKMQEYKNALAEHPEQLATALEQLAIKIRKNPGSVRYGYRGSMEWDKLPAQPQKPGQNSRLCEIERQLRLLNLSSEKSISVDERSGLAKFICNIG